MEIYIPTRGRVNLQRTLTRLPDKLLPNTHLVVDAAEAVQYATRWKHVKVSELPENCRGIAYIRQWIMDTCEEPYLVMLDDDLIFQSRTPENTLRNSTEEQIIQAFNWMEETLASGKAHCGLGIRLNNNRQPRGSVEIGRMMHVLAYNKELFLQSGASFSRDVEPWFSMDDFNITLQLLKAGYGNVVSMEHVSSPASSNTKGGASLWRTLETQNKTAHKLQELHGSELVTVKKKANWQGMEGDRYDVIVRWKKAFESAKKGE